MASHKERVKPALWQSRVQGIKSVWLIPFLALEWGLEWLAYALGNWTVVEVLEHFRALSVLIVAIFYVAGSGSRVKMRHYQAWQVINTAQDKGGSGGRIEALQELNADKVSPVGVDVSSAFLQGVNLKNANLLRSDFSSADLRNSNFSGADFTLASLNSANLRGASLDHAKCVNADLSDVDFVGSSLVDTDLSRSKLDDADLRGADLKDVQWQHIASVKAANVAGVKNAPPGFVDWALKNGAVDHAESVSPPE